MNGPGKSKCLKKRILVPVIFLASVGNSRTAPLPESKSLARTVDPIVMECKDLAPLFGTAPEQLALMVFDGNAWAPIPFQIDQKKPDGTYAYTSGPQASADPDPNLDANDELVFMAKDAGDKAGPDVLPPGMTKAMELEITDPVNGQKAWAYLGKYQGQAPRSAKDYVKLALDPKTKHWRFTAQDFVLQIPEGYISADYLALVNKDGSLGPDILDREKLKMEITVNLIHYTFDIRGDSLIRAETRGWIDGPVRVVQYNEGYVQVARWIRFRMGGNMENKLYPFDMESPLEMEPPEVANEDGSTVTQEEAKKSPTTLNEYVYIDFNSKAYGAKCFSKIHPLNPEVVFDGKMSRAEEDLDHKTAVSWAGLVFPEGTLVARVDQDPKPAKEKFLPRIYYLDDQTAEDKPEDEKGISAIGMSLYHVEEATAEAPPRMSSTVTNYIYFHQGFPPDQAREYLDIKDHPLKITARPVGDGKGRGP